MRLSGKRVFLSGPMSGVGHWNVDGFALAHEKVKESGAAQVYNPAMEYLEGGDAKEPHEKCMRRTLAELTREREFPEGLINTHVPHYDVIVMLPGWEKSLGAKLEMDVAIACGIKVVMLGDVETGGGKPAADTFENAKSYKMPPSFLKVGPFYMSSGADTTCSCSHD